MATTPSRSEPKCRCGAYAKPELRHRVTNQLCCAGCYNASWEGHGAEWEASFRVFEDDNNFAPDPIYEEAPFYDDY